MSFAIHTGSGAKGHQMHPNAGFGPAPGGGGSDAGPYPCCTVPAASVERTCIVASRGVSGHKPNREAGATIECIPGKSKIIRVLTFILKLAGWGATP